jgi:hypothetical protein
VLIQKLRDMRKDHALRIVDLRDTSDDASPAAGADDVMARTLKIPEHRQALRPFVRVTGPLDDLCALTGNLAEALTAASTQVFGMMLDSEVRPSTAPLGVTDVCATFELTVRHQYLVRLDFCFTKQDAARVVARARAHGAGAATEKDVTTALTELLTLVRKRLQTTIVARHVECECSSPRVRHLESMEMDVPQDGHGLQLPFATATGEGFVLLAKITKGVRSASAVA